MTSPTNVTNNAILALDVGEKRVGVALASSVARLATPLTTLANDEHILTNLRNLVNEHYVGVIVVGHPRDMQGNATAQTTYSQAFADQLNGFGVPVVFQDESLTSVKAEERLRAMGKPFVKQDIDAEAAGLILTDYLQEHPAGNQV